MLCVANKAYEDYVHRQLAVLMHTLGCTALDNAAAWWKTQLQVLVILASQRGLNAFCIVMELWCLLCCPPGRYHARPR
jgi:hypothetical protein